MEIALRWHTGDLNRTDISANLYYQRHDGAHKLTVSKQLPLFANDLQSQTPIGSNGEQTELGTFKDSMRAPIHNWFRYPAGYSYKFVDAVFRKFNIASQHWVYDPFSGTGTTLVSAKQKNVNAYGVEAHTFVHWVAEVKLYWNFNYGELEFELQHLITACHNYVIDHFDHVDLTEVFPELVYKCYHPRDLQELYLIRTFVTQFVTNEHIRNLLKLALTDTLRSAAAAGTGWPYIAPNKNTGLKPPKGAMQLFFTKLWKMFRELRDTTQIESKSEIRNILGDSRQTQDIENSQVDLALTSPPYLNNYDYADRTRLETYFWGITNNWKDITDQFRDKLIVAATTQVIRKKYKVETALSDELRQLAPDVYQTIQTAVLQLSQLRTQKGGKKDYDLMVALYFNDMLPVLQETFRVLKPHGHFCIVIGDSAPYGVHIATEDLIGRLGLSVGFSRYQYEEFRTRGGKWKDNPQRHNIPLREGVVTLTK